MIHSAKRLVVACLLGAGVLSQSASSADVAAIGDSMMKSVGRAIRKQYKTADADTKVLTSIGSGLARLDQFDWHAQAKALMAAEAPAMVFVMVGTNDNQPMRTGAGVLAFGTPGWDVEYGRRVGKLMDVLLDDGKRRVVWIGLPRMREDKLDADVRTMETIVRQQIDAREGVTFFSTVELLSPASGYKAYIKQDNGMPLDVRSADGIHLNRNGAKYLAERLFKKYPAPALK